MSAMTLAAVLIDELVRCGLSDVCLAPGSRSAPLAVVAVRHPDVRVHVGIDERSVAFLALGIAKVDRRPAAVVTTSGTAAANLHPAVVEAHESRTPLLVLTADRPAELRGTAANQTTDQVKLFGDAVRWFAEVGDHALPESPVAYWRSLADRAWREAVAGPAGAVHLNIPLREPLVPPPGADDPPVGASGGRPGGAPWTAAPRAGRCSDDAVAALGQVAASVERGLIVVGDTTASSGAILRFADATTWPLLAEPVSSVRTGPQAIASYHHLLGHAGFAGLHRPDFVLRVGKIGLSRNLLAFLDAEVPQMLVDPDGAWLDPGRAVREIVAADPDELLTRAVQRFPARKPTAWLSRWRTADTTARGALTHVLDAHGGPSEPVIARELAAALPDGALLVAASSMPVRDLDMHMVPRSGLRVIANRGASGIDGFVSTALGAALRWPGPVCALAGDLSLLHDQNGFLLLGEQPDLTVVVVNNDGGGIFSLLPQSAPPDVFERVFGTPHGRDLARLAELHQLGYNALTDTADLPGALAAARAEGGVQLIEVRTDRAGNAALHERLTRGVGQALDRQER